MDYLTDIAAQYLRRKSLAASRGSTLKKIQRGLRISAGLRPRAPKKNSSYALGSYKVLYLHPTKGWRFG